MSRSSPVLGLTLAGIAAIAFATNTTAARVAYDGGSNPLTYLSLRTLLALVLVLALVVIVRADLRMPLARRLKAMGLGAVLALYSFGLLSAIEYIPVALATLIFYTFPLLTSLVVWVSGHERPTPIAVVALSVAAGGLVLALDVGGHTLDLRGVALAAMAAVAITGLVIANARLVGNSDSRPVTVHMMASASVIYLIATLAFGEYALPTTDGGWAGLAGGMVCYTIAITSWFVALSIIGPVRASLTMNLEPVSSLLLGFLILGQALTAWQVLGVALVVGSVFAVRLDTARRTKARAAPAETKGETP